MKKSLWQNYIRKSNFEKIEENLETDILIIGAGITGITTAYNLVNSKHKVLLIDGNSLFNNTTAKTTGKITYLQELNYQRIINIYDFQTAKLYYESQKEAIKIIKKNIKENNISCDFEKSTSITFTNDPKEVEKIELEKEILKNFGAKVYSEEKSFNKIKKLNMLSVKDTYVFNPVKYLYGLLDKIKKSKNITTLENSKAYKIKFENDKYIVKVNDYYVKTKKIVLACNYPFFTIPGLFPLKSYVEKSYITAAKIKDKKNINGITSNYPTLSFRYTADNFFILLSNSSRVGDKINYAKNYQDCINNIKKLTSKNPNYAWSNMDVLTHDYLPLIGKITSLFPDIFIATGYNTWGMTNGTLAGKIISDMINNKKNKYEEIFKPTRKLKLKKIKSIFVNTLCASLKSFSFNLIKKNPSWYKNKVFVTYKNKKRVGIYYDDIGKEHIVSNVCPHLKCFLTFNTIDKTWDCPCHGSRFDIDGNSIKGPSVYNIKIDESNE